MLRVAVSAEERDAVSRCNRSRCIRGRSSTPPSYSPASSTNGEPQKRRTGCGSAYGENKEAANAPFPPSSADTSRSDTE